MISSSTRTVFFSTVAVAVLVLSACSGRATKEPNLAASSAGQPSSVGEASEEEVGTGGDQAPDEPMVPEAELSAAERIEMLRLPATDAARTGSCSPEDVSAELVRVGVSLGHRYAGIVLTNDGVTPCELSGFPGVGARGEWGSRFMVEADQRPLVFSESEIPSPSPAPGGLVTLAPSGEARVKLEWTGALGGAYSEPLEVLYLQLFRDTEPLIVEDPGGVTSDLGTFSTVRVGDIESSA